MSLVLEYNPVATCWLTFVRSLPASRGAFYQIWGFNQVNEWYDQWPILVYYYDREVFIKNGPNAFRMWASVFVESMEGGIICGRFGTQDTILPRDWIAAQEDVPELIPSVHVDWQKEGF